ncbi:MAG: rod shape-determining protein MreC [Acidobacteriota bacterium]|jgi:rod shape-determining protein MreC
MTENVRRNPFFGLLALVVLNLFLLSVQVRSENGRLILRSWGLAAFTPFALTADVASNMLHGVVARYQFLTHLEERNRYLEEQNWQLKTELNRLEALRRQVREDESFKLLAERFDFRTIRAAVVWRNLPMYAEKVIVNAGLSRHVHRDSAVITPDGVVGRVRASTQFTSEVELLTDVNAAAGAQVGETGLQGIIQGTGREELRLNFILGTESVQPGEVVYTSGTDGIYPKGVPIGKVVRTERTTGIYQRIVVLPFVQFSRLEEVAVVIDEP